MLKVLGAVFPHFCPNKREIWHRGADLPFAPPTKFHVYRGNVSPLRGEKPIFGPVEFYLYPTVGTVLIHSVKPELTE